MLWLLLALRVVSSAASPFPGLQLGTEPNLDNVAREGRCSGRWCGMLGARPHVVDKYTSLFFLFASFSDEAPSSEPLSFHVRVDNSAPEQLSVAYNTSGVIDADGKELGFEFTCHSDPVTPVHARLTLTITLSEEADGYSPIVIKFGKLCSSGALADHLQVGLTPSGDANVVDGGAAVGIWKPEDQHIVILNATTTHTAFYWWTTAGSQDVSVHVVSDEEFVKTSHHQLGSSTAVQRHGHVSNDGVQIHYDCVRPGIGKVEVTLGVEPSSPVSFDWLKRCDAEHQVPTLDDIGHVARGITKLRLYGSGFSLIPTDNQVLLTLSDQSQPVVSVIRSTAEYLDVEVVPQLEVLGEVKGQVTVAGRMSDPWTVAWVALVPTLDYFGQLMVGTVNVSLSGFGFMGQAHVDDNEIDFQAKGGGVVLGTVMSSDESHLAVVFGGYEQPTPLVRGQEGELWARVRVAGVASEWTLVADIVRGPHPPTGSAGLRGFFTGVAVCVVALGLFTFLRYIRKVRMERARMEAPILQLLDDERYD